MGQSAAVAVRDLLPYRYRCDRVLADALDAATLLVFDRGFRQAQAIVKCRQLGKLRELKPEVAEFTAYAETLQALRHPSIAAPYTHGVLENPQGSVFGYSTREFVSGAVLSDIRGPFPPTSVALVGAQICRGLEALHSCGLRHGDLKAENVVVRRARDNRIDSLSQCVLIDIDYRERDAEGNLSLNDVTLQYVAPELTAGEQADGRSDLFSLGVMMYRLLTGQMPFSGNSLAQIMQAQRTRDYAPLSGLRPDTPPRLVRLVDQLLDPRRAHRPESAAVTLSMLEEWTISQSESPDSHCQELNSPVFVGRQTELRQCMTALAPEVNTPGESCIEVTAPSGGGVTTFLRELQDQLESRGFAVLNPQPQARSGSTLMQQLAHPIQHLTRRVEQSVALSSVGIRELRRSASSSELLDDLAVASSRRPVVIVVDEWRLCGASEVRFLARAVAQARAIPRESSSGRSRCSVVLGGGPGRDWVTVAAEGLSGMVSTRVFLGPLELEDVVALSASAHEAGVLHAGEALEVVERGHRTPAACLRILSRFVRSCDSAKDRRERLSEAIEEEERRAEEFGGENAAADAIVKHPLRRSLVALHAWGQPVRAEEWDDLRRELDPEVGECDASDWIEWHDETGWAMARPRCGHMTSAMLRRLEKTDREQIARVLTRVGRATVRSDDCKVVRDYVHCVARLGVMPDGIAWHVLRGLVTLFRSGAFADVIAVTATLSSSTGGTRTHGWIPLFRAAAAIETGERDGAELAMSVANDTSTERWRCYAAWALARLNMHAGDARKGVDQLEALASSDKSMTHLRHSQRAFREDLGRAQAAAGRGDAARATARQILRAGRSIRQHARLEPTTTERPAPRRSHWPARPRRLIEAVASAFRVMGRAASTRHKFCASQAAARREARAYEMLGNQWQLANSLTNYGSVLMARDAPERARETLARVVSIREALDDERGVVKALVNLSYAEASCAEFSRAAAVLNRARIIAERNQLRYERDAAMINLAIAYYRNGQLGDARHVTHRLIALGGREGNFETQAKALYNYCHFALDEWHIGIARRCITALRSVLPRCPRVSRDASTEELEARMTARLGAWDALGAIVGRDTPDDSTSWQAYYGALLRVRAGSATRPRNSAGRSRDTQDRVPLLVAKCGCRAGHVSFDSVMRIVRACERRGLRREALEAMATWVCGTRGAHVRQVERLMRVSTCKEYREGNDDLQILVRVGLSRLLRERERGREADLYLVEAVQRFSRLARKLARIVPTPPVLLSIRDTLMQELSGDGGKGSLRESGVAAPLLAAAFSHVVRSGSRTTEARAWSRRNEAQLAECLSRQGSIDQTLRQVLTMAVQESGAERAAVVLVDETGSARVTAAHGAGHADEDVAEERLSWAVLTEVLTGGKAAIYGDALASEELASHRSVSVLNLRSLACVPIKYGSTVLGALYLDHRSVAGLFSEEDLEHFALLAAAIAGVLELDQSQRQLRESQLKLEEAERQLIRTERSRMAAQLVGGLAHDIKNLLATIIARAQMMRSDQSWEQVKLSLGAIERAAHASAGMIERLQDCTRDHSGASEETVDLGAILRESMELMTPRMTRAGAGEIALSMEVPPAVFVRGIGAELREVFLNLLVNACDAMPSGGKLSVAIRSSGDGVIAEIRDSGHGMTEAIRKRIFEPFFTTKGKAGTGLGLTVVRNVVVKLGGSVDVESEVGLGTTFRMKFPVVVTTPESLVPALRRIQAKPRQ